MRITQNILITNFLRNLDSISSRISRSQDQLATGKVVNKPSDGPIEISRIMSFQFASDRMTQYVKNIDDGASQVGYADTILQSLNTDLGRARVNSVNAANDSLNSVDRIAIGKDISLILDSTLQNANSRFRDRYTFAGYNNRNVPFEAIYNRRTGEIQDVIYKGNKGIIDRLVGDNDKLSVNVNGSDLFMNQTYTRLGKSLPANVALGFQGVITVNDIEFQVTTDQTLTDIAQMLNAASPDSGVFAEIESSQLKLESAKAIGEFTLTDNTNGELLQDLGLYVGGAYNIGSYAPVLPLIDSTPAIFDAAGPVANLSYNSSNNVLNIFLGADANSGASKAANIKISEKTFASVDELVTDIQSKIDTAFGANKIKVTNVAGTLRIETVATGSNIDPGDLVIGGTHFGIPDTASDSADLNLVNIVGNAPATPAGTAGTNGNDKLIIDLGPTTSKTGLDVPPQTIDFRASQTATVDELIDEIRYQIFQNDVLRGAVTVELENGRLKFQTVKTGAGVKSSDFAFSEGATGTLTALGLEDAPSGAQIIGATLTFPFIVVAGFNDTLTIDLGPTVSGDGTNIAPVTLKINPGVYGNFTSIYNELNAQIQGSMDLNGSIKLDVLGPPGFEYFVISSIKQGSGVRGQDMRITGNLAGTLGFPIGDAISGGGPSDGVGIELEPSNVFNTLINMRDDCYGIAGLNSNVISLKDSNETLLGMLNGDVVTVSLNGVDHTFPILSSDSLSDFVSNIQDIFGTRAKISLTGDGRLQIENLETFQILDLKISSKSAAGEDRTLFNNIFNQIPSALPGLTSTTSLQMLDSSRYQRLGDEDLVDSDTDQQNVLSQLATIGARANRLTTITNLFSASQQNVKELRNSIEASNYAEVVTYLSQQQLILQSALAVGAKVLSPSLLDFMV